MLLLSLKKETMSYKYSFPLDLEIESGVGEQYVCVRVHMHRLKYNVEVDYLHYVDPRQWTYFVWFINKSLISWEKCTAQ